MKKTLLLFFLFIGTTLCISQTEVIESYDSPLAGKTYVIGDTITIGEKQYAHQYGGSEYYSFMFEFVEDGEYYSAVSNDLKEKRAVIDKIFEIEDHPYNRFEDKTVIRIKTNDGKSYFIPVEDAIKAKEFVVYENKVDFNGLAPFNNELVVLLKIKNKTLSGEQAMRYYIEELDPDKFRAWKKDEFLYEEEKNEYIRNVDSLSATVDAKDTFVIVLPAMLNDYNFETNSFPFHQGVQAYSKKYGNFDFINYLDFNSLEVPKERAHFYAKTNEKSYTGKRKAFVMLKVIIDDMEIVKKKSSGMNLGGSEVTEEANFSIRILELHCVDNEALFYNYLGGSE